MGESNSGSRLPTRLLLHHLHSAGQRRVIEDPNNSDSDPAYHFACFVQDWLRVEARLANVCAASAVESSVVALHDALFFGHFESTANIYIDLLEGFSSL